MLELYDLPDEALAELLHDYAEEREHSIGPSFASGARLDGAMAIVSAVTGLPDRVLSEHLEGVYETVGTRPAEDTKYYIVWERDAIQALRKRVSPLEEVRNA